MSEKKPSSMRRFLAARASILFLRAASRVPLPVARGLAGLLARVAYYTVPRIRKVGLRNLDLAYGDTLPTSEKRRILRQAVRHVALVAAEFSRLPQVAKDERALPIKMVGHERLLGEGGTLCIGAHLGNWELLGPVLARLGKPIAGVVRPLDDPALNRVVDDHRKAGGATTIPKDNAGREMVRLLREGWNVGVLIDQCPRENGIPATFFGQPCWATIAPALIGSRAKAPVVPGCVSRQPDGTFLFELGEPIPMVQTDDMLADLRVNTQRCQDAIEAMVRKYPEQWLWFHRRWKERPRLAEEWEERQKKARSRATRPEKSTEGVS